jgi:hypothetical protein
VNTISQIVTNAATLPSTAPKVGRDWGNWTVGLWSAFIVGFSGAAGSAGGGAAVGISGLKNYLILMGVSGATAGVISLFAYLHNHPAPEPYTGEERRNPPQP